MCEIFFLSLKEEWKQQLKVEIYKELKLAIDNYIDFYNYSRIRVKTKTPPCAQYFLTDQKKKKIEIMSYITHYLYNKHSVYLTKYIHFTNSAIFNIIFYI